MEVLYPRCCGLAVHKSSIAACALLREQGRIRTERRRFTTMTQDLQDLAAWLRQLQVTHVAIESTGVYWKPVWNILEGLSVSVTPFRLRKMAVTPHRYAPQFDQT